MRHLNYMKRLKETTKDIIKEVAEELMNANDTTTNLDIKKELRKMGYFATQLEVASYMDTLSIEEDYNIDNNGLHRIFSFKEITHCFNNTTLINSNVSTSTSTTSTKNRSIKDILELSAGISPSTGDWIVTCVLPTYTDTLFFDKKYTRDEVRRYYRKLYNIDIQYTRSRRSK